MINRSILKRSSLLESISITNLLIFVNVLVFIVVYSLSLYNPSTISFIALNPQNFINNYYIWTLLTSMFMHGGFAHLFVNMISLAFIGNFVEKIIGRKRFLSIYLISGIFAGLFFIGLSILFGSSNFLGTGYNTAAVGASGALFGIAGVMMILTPNLSVYAMFIPIPIKSKYAIPGMLILIAMISLLSGWPIGNSAHFGGLIAGIIYGIYLKNKYKRKAKAISIYFQ